MNIDLDKEENDWVVNKVRFYLMKKFDFLKKFIRNFLKKSIMSLKSENHIA